MLGKAWWEVINSLLREAASLEASVLIRSPAGIQKVPGRIAEGDPAGAARGGVPWACNATRCWGEEQLGRQAASARAVSSMNCVFLDEALTVTFHGVLSSPKPLPQLPKFPKL